MTIEEIYNSLSEAQKENITAIGRGPEKKNDEKTGKDAIVFKVKEKKEISALSAEEIIPSEIDGYVTDVEGSDEITASADRKKYRPAIGGCSAMHEGGSACTLGCVIWRGEEMFLLGNQHCYMPAYEGVEKGTPILQPSPYDGGEEDDKIAEAHETVEFDKDNFNLVDAALAKVTEPEKVEDLKVMNIGNVDSNIASVEPGEIIKKRGRTTEYTKGEVRMVDSIAKVNYEMEDGSKETIKFKDQIFVEGDFLAGGDSSSLALNKNNQPVGLCFAGSDKVSVLNDISHVCNELNFDFSKPKSMDILQQELSKESVVKLYTLIHRRKPSQDALEYFTGKTLGQFMKEVKDSEEWNHYTGLIKAGQNIEEWVTPDFVKEMTTNGSIKFDENRDGFVFDFTD